MGRRDEEPAVKTGGNNKIIGGSLILFFILLLTIVIVRQDIKSSLAATVTKVDISQSNSPLQVNSSTNNTTMSLPLHITVTTTTVTGTREASPDQELHRNTQQRTVPAGDSHTGFTITNGTNAENAKEYFINCETYISTGIY